MADSPSARPRAARYAFVLAAYCVWILAGALAAGVAVVVYLVLTGLYLRFGLDPWSFKLFAVIVATVLGGGWFVAVGWGEHHLAQAPDAATLARRAVRLFLPGAALLALGYLAARFVPSSV